MRRLVLPLLLTLACCAKMRPEAAAPPGSGAPGAPASDKARSALAPGVARRVIHHADLELEADSADEALRVVGAVAEARGGFLLSSDTRRDSEGTHLHIVLRVPAREFQGALAALRGAGRRVASESVTGEDVTEEYEDLEARLRAARAVEASYLELLTHSASVHDSLEVQAKLGEARTEIERLEGRQRYLQDQTDLSTITVRLTVPEAPALADSLREAGQDAVTVGRAVLVGSVRLVGVLLPVFALLVLPLVLLVRLAKRRSPSRA
jgi:hypothetical protein